MEKASYMESWLTAWDPGKFMILDKLINIAELLYVHLQKEGFDIEECPSKVCDFLFFLLRFRA